MNNIKLHPIHLKHCTHLNFRLQITLRLKHRLEATQIQLLIIILPLQITQICKTLTLHLPTIHTRHNLLLLTIQHHPILISHPIHTLHLHSLTPLQHLRIHILQNNPYHLLLLLTRILHHSLHLLHITNLPLIHRLNLQLHPT